jgi:sugar diacid utilization regulator/predicted hydrocarbon binding protein
MQKFNLKELLEFKPEDGIISLKENRLVLFHATALVQLKYELICSLGKDIAQGILYRFGYRCGVYDAKMIIRDYGMEIKYIDLGPIIYRWKGNGQVKVIKEMRYGPNLSRYHVEGRWENSHEAEQFVQQYGLSGYPVCWISTGYASGFSSIISGQKMVCIEKTCAGMGHEHCNWEMRTRENWGDSAVEDLYDLNYKSNFKNLQTMMAEQKAIDIKQKMTQLVLEGQGIKGIADALSEIVGSQIVVFDRFLNVVTLCWNGINSSTQPDILKNSLQEYLAGEIVKDVRPLWQDKKGMAKLSCLMENREQKTWIVSPIVAGSKIWGYILIEEEKEFSEENLFIIEHAGTLCALDYLKQESALEVELRLKGDLLEELFGGRDLKQEEIVAWAIKLGCYLTNVHRVFVIDIIRYGSDYNHLTGDVFDFVKAGIDDLIKRHFPGSLVAVKKKRILVLLRMPEQEQYGEETGDFSKLTKSWAARNLVNYSVNIVWGRPCLEFEDYRKSYDEAWKTANILRDLNRKNQSAGYEDLGIYALLWESGNKEQLKDYALTLLRPLLEYDREHNTNFMETLELFLRKNCSLTDTAKSAFFHINTLRYRMKRIEELTGINLSRDEDRFHAQLSLRLFKILNELKEVVK